ncbi:hypothetical protein AX17_007384 [Amanita inopinata Kibby_2008]|nr:hypothetical protein AX17_007384 [Amanita inopinata Kibby_2008]
MKLSSIPSGIDWPIQFCIFATILTYTASIITSNVSQVDRLWTFLPTIYTAYFALLPLWPNTQPFLLFPYTPKTLGHDVIKDFSPRALLMFRLVIFWMFRLTYNTWRRGLFSLHDEDYRWMVLRNKIPAWLFQVFNLTFIAIIQNILLLLLGLPTASAAMLQPHDTLATSDIVLAFLALVVLVVEFTADNQQYAFQSYKHAYLAKKKGDSSVEQYDENKHWPGARLAWTPADADRGFLTRGLWAWSRHPNFACEQGFWWIITLIPLLAPSPPFLPSVPVAQLVQAVVHPNTHLAPLLSMLWPDILHILPAASLSLLFFSSTLFTESISKGKYPEAYAAYQQRVGMFGISSTVVKSLICKFCKSDASREKIDKLVWGEPRDTKKTL